MAEGDRDTREDVFPILNVLEYLSRGLTVLVK